MQMGDPAPPPVVAPVAVPILNPPCSICGDGLEVTLLDTFKDNLQSFLVIFTLQPSQSATSIALSAFILDSSGYGQLKPAPLAAPVAMPVLKSPCSICGDDGLEVTLSHASIEFQ